MNRQREVIYTQRRKVLDGENLRENIISMIKETIDAQMKVYTGNDPIPDNWNLEGLRDFFLGWLTTADDFNYTAEDFNTIKKKTLKKSLKIKQWIYMRQEKNNLAKK
jgi:preprotein translocase subunit SecA